MSRARKTAEPSTGFGVRLPLSVLARIDTLAAELSERDPFRSPVRQGEAMRAALLRGLAAYEEEFTPTTPPRRPT